MKSAETPFDRIRCYFGEPTPVLGEDHPDQHLKAPNPGKLFFISPPPSPPCGWEIREEDPPNKETHAEDLERALAGLNNGTTHDNNELNGDTEMTENSDWKGEASATEFHSENEDVEGRRLENRGRTKSTTVYHPKDHGSKQDLPAVIVSDTGAEEEDAIENQGALGGVGKTLITHTSRPPVELMEE